MKDYDDRTRKGQKVILPSAYGSTSLDSRFVNLGSQKWIRDVKILQNVLCAHQLCRPPKNPHLCM